MNFKGQFWLEISMALYQSEHDTWDADDGNIQTQSCDNISTYSVSDYQYHNTKIPNYIINTPYDTI